MAFYALCNHGRRLVLIASPKCGTRTCKRWLLDSLLPSERPATGDGWVVDVEATMVPLERLGDRDFDDYHVAMVVRDPHRRMVAAYADQFVRRGDEWGYTDLHANVWPPRRTFRDVVESVSLLHRHRVPLQHHLEPQVHRVNLDRIDQFLVVERLEHDLADLACRIMHAEHRSIHEGATPYPAADSNAVMDRPPEWFVHRGFPPPAVFYDRSLHATVASVYREDVDLYRSILGTRPLLPAAPC